MKSKKKLFSLMLMFTFIFTSFAGSAFAAGEKVYKIDELKLSYWVEYDKPEKWPANDPAVLVMYNGSVINTSTQDFQGEIGFYIPDNAQINMVCETEKGMVCQPYKIDKTDKGSYLTWKPTRAIKPGEKFPFMLEFYYNPIKGTEAKTIDYTFTASMDIDALEVDIKAPLKASNFQIEPQAPQTAGDNEGFAYHLYSFKGVKSEEGKAFKIVYNKKGSEPSAAALATGQPASPDGGGSNTNKLNTPAMLGIFVFVLIVGAFFYVAVKGNNNAAYTHKIKTSKKKQQRTQPIKASESERKKARKLLLEGKISEETYQELIAEADV